MLFTYTEPQPYKQAAPENFDEIKVVEYSALQQAQEEIKKLKERLLDFEGKTFSEVHYDEIYAVENAKLKVALNTAKNDYWFMTNLLERYSTNKDDAIKDCIERMKFRRQMFEALKECE